MVHEGNYDPFECLKHAVINARDDMPNVFVCHPGYIDDDLMRNSSQVLRETAMVCSLETEKWLMENKIQLIDYRDI